MKRKNKNTVLGVALSVLCLTTLIPTSASAAPRVERMSNQKVVVAEAMPRVARRLHKSSSTDERQSNTLKAKKEKKKINGTTYPEYNPPKKTKKKINGTTYPEYNPPKKTKKKINGTTYPEYNPPKQPKKKINGTTYPEYNPPKQPKKKINGTTYPEYNPPKQPKKKIDGTRYPDYNPPQEIIDGVILDAKEAKIYLQSVLEELEAYDMSKYQIRLEEKVDLPIASDMDEWHFAYGRKVKNEFQKISYFAVTEEGDVYVYEFDVDEWATLEIPY